MAALSDWQRPALSSSYKYIMFVWSLKPRVKEVALVPWFVALLQNGEWKLCGKGVVFTLRDKAAGEAGYIEEKQVAKILGRSLQRLNLSAGHRSTQQQFNKLYFCFLYLCISSLKTFLRGRVQFNHSIVFLFLWYQLASYSRGYRSNPTFRIALSVNFFAPDLIWTSCISTSLAAAEESKHGIH